ncbi:hypothetical protein C2G38_2205293 [Gigaspora rosea]|uniref:Uncharacterized protein n=1 Tax=Gigaspora rosea TaxID=44941 RepID=A0A397UKG6_9GLOM|nr:hypothetical protein C2G38_2205293 [Gigaspora rosea]
MSEMKHCEACQTTDSAKFRSLGGEMWKKAVNNAKNTNIDEDAENEVTREEEESTKIDLSEAIKMLAIILYEREYEFFDQICLAARPLEHSSQTMDRMKKLMLFICYLLASLHNSKINEFKFDIANYLDSVGASNKEINTMANLGVTLTTRSVNRNKRRTSNAHEEHVGVALVKHSENAFVLNIDDYHNIHTPHQPDTTTTSFSSSMSTILVNPYQISPIPRIRAINPKIVDYELIDSKKICSEDELIDRLTNDLKGVVGYMNALRVVHNQEPMQEYLFNNAIPIIANWLGQFYIRKAIAHRYLLNNETIPSFVTSFLPMMGPLHVSLNAHIFYWMETNHPMFNMIVNNLDSLSDFPVEIVHSIIRQRTSKFFTAEQLRTEAHCYEVSDCHLPRGFVTAKKPSIVALCDYVHCRNSNYSVDGIVLACGHGYHNHCLQICRFKCLICLEYLNDKIIENFNALIKSLKKKLDEKELDVEDFGIIVDDNSNNADDVVDDIPEDLLELENAKESFLKIS